MSGATGEDMHLRRLTGPALKRIHHLLQSEAARELEPLGLRGATWAALSVICDRPGLRLSQLAELLGAEKSNTVVSVETLESAGLIEREREENDRRALSLCPTEKGRALCARANGLVAAQEERALKSLTAREKARLLSLLRKIDPPVGDRS